MEDTDVAVLENFTKALNYSTFNECINFTMCFFLYLSSSFGAAKLFRFSSTIFCSIGE